MESSREKYKSCDEIQSLLPLFADGELNAREMQVVAAHSVECLVCDREVRKQERVQLLLRELIASRLAEVSTKELWPRIEARLRCKPTPRWQRGFRAVGAIAWRPGVLWPALAALFLAVIATALYWRYPGETTSRGGTLVAGAEPPAFIDALEADAASVTVMDDWQNHATVLWVTEEQPATGGPEQ